MNITDLIRAQSFVILFGEDEIYSFWLGELSMLCIFFTGMERNLYYLFVSKPVDL